jgi:hypothetical protein
MLELNKPLREGVMQNIESLKINGALRVILTGPDGAVKDDRELKNLVVDTGLNFIVKRMKDAVTDVMSHMSLGEGNTPAVAADTTLETEIAGSRVSLTSTSVTANQITYIANFAAGVGTGAVKEAGIFNAGSGGTMLCRTVFPVVNKQSGDSMTVTWTITVQ